MFDPREERWTPEVAAHLEWWEVIWSAQRARGMAVSIIEPEHGPPPYQQYDAMPRRKSLNDSDSGGGGGGGETGACGLSQVDMDAILWDINTHVKDLVVSKFQSSK